MALALALHGSGLDVASPGAFADAPCLHGAAALALILAAARGQAPTLLLRLHTQVAAALLLAPPLELLWSPRLAAAVSRRATKDLYRKLILGQRTRLAGRELERANCAAGPESHEHAGVTGVLIA